MNRYDRQIAIAALSVAVVALVGIWLAGDSEPPTTYAPSSSLSSSNHQEPRQAPDSPPVRYDEASPRHVETFSFDPNTADSTTLLRLGLTPWQVRNIYRYRAKGGIYRRKEDFARLYGLTVKDYHRLEPYIHISNDYQPAATLVKEDRRERDTLRYPVKLQGDERVVLNTADTTQLCRVPGIGPYYAREIVRHGQRLGGYVSVDQLDEISDFPQESKKYFVIQQPNPQRLNVNRLTLQQLRRHPYINFYQAKAIVEYRRLHGPLKSLQDLRLSPDFPPEEIARLEPYVSF